MQLTSLSLALTRAGFLSAFSPASLFAAGEQGVFFDPSDMSTMFQDAAGVTPVTAVEQPVGLILDKSKGLVLGPELIPNGDFSSSTGWTLSTGVSISNGVCTFTNVSGGNAGAVRVGLLTAGKRYRCTVTVLSVSGGLLYCFFAGNESPTIASPGTYTFDVVAGTATTNFGVVLKDAGPVNAVIDTVSVKEVQGNHATQTTATSRPVLSARVNLLTATETLPTQTVTTRATTQTLRFEGAGTVTLSGTATGTYSAGSHSITTTAGNLTLTVSGTVTKADLRATNMGVGLPAYQRVNTATDYDTAGFPHYLRFDGVDDWLVTPSIDFTATDKMTVWAGVRRLTSVASGVIVELSVNRSTNPGAFTVVADNASRYQFNSSGSTGTEFCVTAIQASPNSVVLTGTNSIAGNEIQLRQNGFVESNGDGLNQGTGNYGNYPLYIGHRGGTSLPFNGQIYGLVIRGAASTTSQIQQTEAWLNQRTGAF